MPDPQEGPLPDSAHPRPGEEYLSTPMIAKLYGLKPGTVRNWKIKPAFTLPWGGKVIRFFLRADVEAYANSPSRLNRHAGQERGRLRGLEK